MSFGYTIEGLTLPDFNITFALSGENVNVAELEGLAVTQDTTTANTVKLATADSEVLGVIMTAEDGKDQGEGISVTVALKGGYRLPYDGTAPSVGNKIAGAGAGKVKAAGSGVASHGRVWEVDTANKEVVVYFE